MPVGTSIDAKGGNIIYIMISSNKESTFLFHISGSASLGPKRSAQETSTNQVGNRGAEIMRATKG